MHLCENGYKSRDTRGCEMLRIENNFNGYIPRSQVCACTYSRWYQLL